MASASGTKRKQPDTLTPWQLVLDCFQEDPHKTSDLKDLKDLTGLLQDIHRSCSSNYHFIGSVEKSQNASLVSDVAALELTARLAWECHDGQFCTYTAVASGEYLVFDRDEGHARMMDSLFSKLRTERAVELEGKADPDSKCLTKVYRLLDITKASQVRHKHKEAGALGRTAADKVWQKLTQRMPTGSFDVLDMLPRLLATCVADLGGRQLGIRSVGDRDVQAKISDFTAALQSLDPDLPVVREAFVCKFIDHLHVCAHRQLKTQTTTAIKETIEDVLHSAMDTPLYISMRHLVEQNRLKHEEIDDLMRHRDHLLDDTERLHKDNAELQQELQRVQQDLLQSKELQRVQQDLLQLLQQQQQQQQPPGSGS
jgi:hypothetical protein